MKVKLLIIISFLIPILLKAQVKVEKVLETSSVADYNRWVQENKEKYPELKPIYFQIERTKDGKYDQDAPRSFNPPPSHPAVDKYEIYYYTEGKKYKESITGYLSFFIYDESEYIGIRRLDHPSEFGKELFIFINKEGNELFRIEDVHILRYLLENMFIKEPQGYGEIFDSLAVLNEKGFVIGNIRNINPDAVRVSPNKEYIAIIQGPIAGWAQAVILSSNLKELWRKKFESWPEVCFGNEHVAICNSGKVNIYNFEGKLLISYNIMPGSPMNPYATFLKNDTILIAFTTDRNEVIFFNVFTQHEIARIELRNPPVITSIQKLIFPISDDFLIIICRNDDALILDKNGKIVKEWNLALPREYTWTIRKTKEGNPTKSKTLKNDWKIKYMDPFLIAIKGKIERASQPSIEKIIVHKIEKE